MFEQANLIIEQRLADTWAATPIDYDNVEFNPVVGQAFVRLQVEWVESAITSIGGRVKGEGYIDLSIFVPSNTGTQLVSSYADILAGIFNKYREGALECRAARTQRVGKQEEWYQMKVIIPFKYDQCY